MTIGPVVLTVWLPPAVDAKDLDPDLEHEKSVPTVEALLALNLKDSAVNVEPDYAGFACTTNFPQIMTIGPVVLMVWLPPAVDAKDLDPDLEHEKSVPTVETLLTLNLKDSAVNIEPFHKSIKFLPEIGFSSWWEKAFMIEVFFWCVLAI